MSNNTNKSELEAKIAELENQLAEKDAELTAKDAELATAMEAAKVSKSQTVEVSSPVSVPEKMVQIKIPLTKEETGDVFVSVNDRQWLIKRGEYVEVPECVAEVLRHQESALRRAIEFIAANEQKLPQ